MTLFKKALVLGAMAALSACGGGGSSGGKIAYTGKTTLATITTSNALTLAGSTGGISSTGSSVGIIGAVSTSPRASYEEALARAEAAIRSMPVTVTGVTVNQTQACTKSGTMTISGSISDPGTGTTACFHAGDWVQLSLAACDDGLGTVESGTMRMTITAMPAGSCAPPSTTTPAGMTVGAYGMAVTLTDVVTTSTATGDWSGMNGDMTLGIAWDGTALTSSITGGSIASQSGNGATITASSVLEGLGGSGRYDLHDVAAFAYDSLTATYTPVYGAFGASLRMCSLEMNPPDGGCVDLSVSPDMKKMAGDLYPSSGTLRITGQAGAYVQLVVQDNQYVTVSYNVGTSSGTVTNVPWTCIDAHVNCPTLP